MNRTQASQCRRIAERYGLRNQEQQAVSELSELLHVLTRRPNQRGESWTENHKETWSESLLDEMADTCIMIEQLRTLHNVSKEALNEKINFKLNRQLDRIGTEEK